MPYKAYVSLKSIITSIYRINISKKNLLEWTTSEQTEKISKTDLTSYYKTMFINYCLGFIAIIYGIFMFNIFLLFLGILWCFIPWIMCEISKIKYEEKNNISQIQTEYFIEVAKRTFAYFEENLTPDNNYLIPDNYQKDRKQKFVDRTSSTNIGLSLLAIITGYDLGFISISKTLILIDNIIKTVESLEKWNGHLYNWYNIKTKNPLFPRYISTVDSGNFVGYLFVLKGFLKELTTDENKIVNDLSLRIDKLIENTDFSVLYSKSHRLFSIGFNIEENKLTDSYYDLLASEARQTSLIAIAKKDVPSKHWNSLSRTLTILNNKKGLISWSGTSFEYLMPNINIPRFKGSLLDESCKFAIMSQIEYAKKAGIPWGISEAAFNLKDFNSNYQYKAFGIPWLGLKRGLAEELVVATYGSVLAVTDKPNEVYNNLKLLEKYGMFDKYGFYESIDFSNQRLRRNEKSAVVSTYMAHHQGLILLSIDNLLKDNIFQKRFMQNPEIEAVSILLQEKMPETFIVTKEEKEMPEKQKYMDYENYAEITYNKLNPNLIRGNVISNQEYMVAINQKGEGISKYKDIYINRFKNTNEYNQGIFFYIKNNKKIWSNYSENSIVTFMPDQDRIETVNDNIKTKVKITVDSEEPVEIRRLEIENIGENEEILEISTVFEPVLSKKEQDYAHPAFNNLFLKFDYDYDKNILEVSRKKRQIDESDVSLMAKFSTDADTIVDNEFEISMERLDERGNIGIPKSIVNSIPFSNKVGLVTEPILAMRKTIKIYPKEKIYIDFIISVNENKEVAINNLEKYNNSESVTRAFEISKAKADAENRYIDIKGKDIVLYQKILSYIIFDNPVRKKQVKKLANRLYSQQELWKYGISGDIPIILIKVKDVNDVYIIKQILKMYEFFRAKNICVDIVFLDEEKHSYENYVRSEIESVIYDFHLEYLKNVKGGIYVLSKDEINNYDNELLNFVSTIIIDAGKGDLAHSLDDIEEEYLQNVSNIDDRIFENDFEEEKQNSNFLTNKENLKYYNEYGAFSPDGKEYLISQNKYSRLPTVWCNIMANEKFGTIVTENMGGYTWFKNSRLNRMSSWHNRAFSDIPSEIIFMQELKTGKTWSLGLNPMPDKNDYNVIYGFGYTKYIHESSNIYQELEVFVPREDSVKIGILKLNNKSMERRKLRIVYYIKPVLGEDEIKSCGDIKVHFDINANIVEAQNLYENEFKSIMYISSSEKIKSYTGDKKFFLGEGGISNPDGLKKYNLNNDNGIGKNACIAMEIEIELESLSTKEIVLTFGAENNIVDLKNMAYKYGKLSNCKQELENVKKYWKNILEKMQVYTPIESLNIILNGWCLYQTISSRLIGRTGYYQSGGAFGFRDQLQDTLSLRYVEPEKMKNQILKHSRHQFFEGDVEHWWHDDTGRGIRTKFSDDLLWLPFMVEKYIETFDDKSILDIETNYIKGKILQIGQDEKYDLYPESDQKESIYLHCIRAIDKSLKFGDNGLPLIGSGDWNDGLNTVGNRGKGESVWLGFFLYTVLKNFIPICELKGDFINAKKYANIIDLLKKNLNLNAWDGRWYKRAFTDDGKVLGSIENEECKIDGISQSWSVISEAGDDNKKLIAMNSLENHLVDKQNGIIKLLDPPFEKSDLNPGYIKSYLTGVRENGGQYTHGAIWAIIAETMLGFGDKATELYKMVNPIEHSKNKQLADKFKVEPFSIPADIYGAGDLIGRGGWTWYTGSSSWYYVTGIEYILGIKIKNNVLYFEPCVSKDWKEFSARYKFKNSVYNIKFINQFGKNTGVQKVILNGETVENKIVLDGSGKIFNIEVIM